MKRFLLLSVIILLAISTHARLQPQLDENPKTNSSTLNGFQISKYAIGSGGVIAAHSSSHMHAATLGQSAVDSSSNSQYQVFAGFWFNGDIAVGLEQAEDMLLPGVYALEQNYPNPFNPQTTIEYALPAISHVVLEIFDITGQRVVRLVDETQTPGHQSLTWKGHNEAGNPVSSGIYFYRITAQPAAGQLFIQTRKMMLIK